MIAYANIFSDDDEEKYGIADVSGAHFYQDTDPLDLDNRVLCVNTCSSVTPLDSTTHIRGSSLSPIPSACELEMKFFFEPMTYVVSPLCFTAEIRTATGARLFSLRFEAVDFLPGAGASKVAMRTEDGRGIDGAVLSAGEWYHIRTEYYPNEKSPAESRLKVYLGSGGERPSLLADISVAWRAGVPARAAIVHSAMQISGKQYFDDLSFALTDKKYSALYETATHESCGKIYDFEDGIPSDRDFNIEMMLKRESDVVIFDPATWQGASGNGSLRRSRSFYEILLVLSGNGRLITDDEEFPLFEGAIFVISPGTGCEILSRRGYKILSIAGHFEHLSFINGASALRDNAYGEGRRLAELVLYNRFGNEDYVSTLCDAYIKFILLNLEMQPKNIVISIRKIIENMEKSFRNSDLSVGELLDESGYARDYIRAEFCDAVGTTPKKYLTELRMKNAKALFDRYGNDISVSEVAEQCGIIDSSVFSRVFKGYFGISPKEYRSHTAK